jgi:hypothetical protein
MPAEPRAIGTRQLERGRDGGLGTSGGRRHFHKAQQQGGCRVRGCHLFFQVDQTQPSLFGHARGRQGRGHGHGLIPERLGKALAGMRPCLAPVLKRPGSLVQLVLRGQRGLDFPVDLHVIGWLS